MTSKGPENLANPTSMHLLKVQNLTDPSTVSILDISAEYVGNLEQNRHEVSRH